ncbi:MAG: urea ABC transporter permease subunit UrtB [Rhodospirillaceae bacterium]|nr:urea ABC transporter permease subunit UrtB [Rhodospirillaceae bacterium]
MIVPGLKAAFLILTLLAVSLAVPNTAKAANFEDALASLATAKTKAKITAIGEIAGSGDERAADALNAFLAGKLYYRKSDKKVLIVKKSGAVYVLTDPLTAKEIGQAPKSKIRKIRVNNRLRKLLRGVLGGLTLLSKDPAKRMKAANAVFKSRSLSVIPTLEQAIARESDAKVKARLVMARAAVWLDKSNDEKLRLTAIETLTEFAVPEVRALLGAVANSKTSEDIRAAAAKALADIEGRLAFWNGVGNVFQGLSLGSVLLLAAVGLAITFGVMGVINMAHGELVMIGAYTTFVVQEVFRNYFPGAFDFSILVAIPAAFLVAGAFGVAIERGIIRYLYGRPLETLLATWGLSLILQQLVRTIFGPTNREVGNPSWMSGAVEVTGGLVLTYNRMWIIVFSLMVLGALVIVAKKTAFGLQMRAVTQNRGMASSMGIRTGWIDALTFGLGSGIAGMAGVAISQIDNVSPNLGQSYIIDSFMVVVFGGVGNLWGTLVGAFSLGIVNKFLEPFAGTVLAKILVLIAIILFIQKRPRGLFALKGRAVES